MRIWKMLPDEVNMIVDAVEDDISMLNFKGLPIEDWNCAEFKAVKKGKFQDYAYWRGGVPVFSSKSLEALCELLANNVQLLDINVVNFKIDFKLVNVTNLVDAIDYSRSIPERSLYGKIVGFKKINFLAEKVESQDIFKIPEFPVTAAYVSDKFKRVVESSKLKGFDFIEVWDSDRTDEVVQAEMEQYQNFLLDLERKKGEEFIWSTAIEKVEEGKMVTSGGWKMQNDKNGVLQIARLSVDCKYSWLKSDIVPPILLGLKWHESENTDNYTKPHQK